MKKINYLSLQLLLSYLSFLTVPLCAILIIYVTASSLLVSVQTEKVRSNLNDTAQLVDKYMEEAGNLSFYLSNSKEINTMVKKMVKSTEKINFYEMYMLSRSFPDYSSFNNAIAEIYIFFSGEDYVMKLPAVVPATDLAYQTVGSLSEESYETMLEQLEMVYYQRKPLSLDGGPVNGKRMAIAQSFSYGQYGNPEGAVVILLDDRFLEKKLSINNINEEGMTMMLGSDSQLHKLVRGEKCELNAAEVTRIVGTSEEGTIRFRLGGEKYVASIFSGNYMYRYITILPERIILQQIGYIKYVIVILCAASAIIGLLACILLWRKRRGLVLTYSLYQDKFGLVATGEKPVKSLWDGMRRVMDYMVDVQSTLHLQGRFIRSTVIRKLLYSEYQTKEEIEENLSHSQIRLEGKGYIVVVISFHKIVQSMHLDKRNEYQLFMQEQVKETILVPHYLCELDQFTLAMILPVESDTAFETTKALLKRFEDELLSRQYVEAYIGIGKQVTSLLEIALSFEEAMVVCEYSRFHDIRMVMSKEDMPKEQDSFFFPMETEIHLMRAIKQGNGDELADLFRLIKYENYIFRKLSLVMMNHLLELIRGTVIRALREGDEQADKDEAEKISQAENIDEIYGHLLVVVGKIQKKNMQKESKKIDGRKGELEKFVETWYHKDDFNIVNLADAFGLSERKAYNEFKACFDGVTFSEYVENIRIKKACELLKQSISVKEVAAMVGYGSDYSFRRAFKRVMGLPPSYYSEGLTEGHGVV